MVLKGGREKNIGKREGVGHGGGAWWKIRVEAFGL
jgi:hypothetical protein